MKRIFTIALALLTVLCLTLPASAANDYGLVLDKTEEMDAEAMTLLAQTLQSLTDTYGVEVRVNIVDGLEDYATEEEPQGFYERFGYGVGEAHDGILLLLYIFKNEDNSFTFGNYSIHTGGVWAEGLEADLSAQLAPLDTWFNTEAWYGDLASDCAVCVQGLNYYASAMGSFLAEQSLSVPSSSDFTYILDEAELLSEEDRTDLEAMAQEIAAQYPCGIYVVTVDDYLDFNTRGVFEAAEQYYLSHGLGYGTDRDGMLLMLSMADRDYALIAYGDYSLTTFTDYGRDLITQEFLDDFRENDWFGGFSDYLSCSLTYLAQAEEGAPVDISNGGNSNDGYRGNSDRGHSVVTVGAIVISLILGFLIALVICLVLKAKMKSVAIAKTARSYLSAEGVQFKIREDKFSHVTETRRRIEHNTSSGGSGSSSHSSGFSGSSGKF